MHITNDIAKVLNLDVIVAEKIKISHGSVYNMRGIIDNIINIASFKNRVNLPKMEDIPILRLFS